MSDLAMADRPVYPFTSRWLDVPAGRMHYIDEGRGETLIFAHGTPTWSYEWRHLIQALMGEYRCIAPDHLGFGLSDRPKEASYTPEAHARRFDAFVERVDPAPFTLVVHDYGGPIALPVCLRHPERVKRLVLINTWMWSFAGDPDMEKKGRAAGGALGRLLYRWANVSLRVLMPYAYGDRTKLTPEVHRQYLGRFSDRWSRGAVLWPLAHAILGSSDYFESLWHERGALNGRPTLIIWGMKDRAFQIQQLNRWRQALPAARVCELPEAGHWPHEEAPDRVAAEIRAFLSAG